MSEERQIDLAIHEIDGLISYLQNRKADLTGAKQSLEQSRELQSYPNSFAFKIPLDKDKGLWRFLKEKILEPHVQKDSLKYQVEEKQNRVLSIHWSEISEQHTKEIVNAAKWCDKRAEEAEAKT